MWLQVVRRLWEAAESFDSATVEQLLRRHEIEQDTMHPDRRAAVAEQAATLSANTKAGSKPAAVAVKAASSGTGTTGDSLIVNTVEAAVSCGAVMDGSLLATLQVLLRNGWSLSRPQFHAALDTLGHSPQEEPMDCRSVLRAMLYLRNMPASARFRRYGDTIDACALYRDVLQGQI